MPLHISYLLKDNINIYIVARKKIKEKIKTSNVAEHQQLLDSQLIITKVH